MSENIKVNAWEAAEEIVNLRRENAALNRKLDDILTNKDYDGGVRFWIKKHDAVLLREASLLAENAALREAKDAYFRYNKILVMLITEEQKKKALEILMSRQKEAQP